MAIITRGPHDELVEKVKTVLDEYERQHPGAVASLYRQNSASIRISVVDKRFTGQSMGDRHDYVWKFVADRLGDEEYEDISMLVLIGPGDRGTDFINAEFDGPIPSKL